MMDILVFFMLKVVLNDLGCLFGVNVLLLNRFGANHVPF